MLLLAACGCLLALAALLALRPRALRRWTLASRLPGPAAYPLIGNAHLFVNKDFLDVLTDLGKAYRTVARFWLGHKLVIGVSKPEYAQAVLYSKYALDKGDFYHFMKPLFGDGLIAADSSIWTVNKKVIAPTLGALKLKPYVSIFSEGSARLVAEWGRSPQGPFEPYQDISKTTFEFIIRTAMGLEPTHKLPWSRGELDRVIRVVSRLEKAVSHRLLRPWLYFDSVFFATRRGRQMRKDYKEFRGFLKRMISIKRAGEWNTNAFGFLEHVLNAAKGHGAFDETALVDELSTYITAGFETTSTATAFVLVMLGIHPALQERVCLEQREIFGDSERPAECGDLSRMQYLERFIKETLRMFPVVPIIGRHLTRDLRVGQFTFPEGAFVLVPVLNFHRDPEVWLTPDVFDPDHFLPQFEAKRNCCSFLPFGAGPRVCLGQRYAMMSMKTMVSTIVRKLRVGADYGLEDIRLSKDVTLSTAGLHISLSTRGQL